METLSAIPAVIGTGPSLLTATRNTKARPLSFVVALTIVLVFLPEGLSIFIAGLRLAPARALFLLLLPFLCFRLAEKISLNRYSFVASDLFVPLSGIWMFIGPSVTGTPANALVHSGPIALEYLIGYMITKILITEERQILRCIGFMCFVISLVCLDGLLDTATGQYFTRDLVSSITGYDKAWNLNQDIYRFGLIRAAGPLEHAILFGFAGAIGLLFSASLPVWWRLFCIVCCAMGVVISFSSAPAQVVILGFGLLTYGRLTAGLTVRWLLLAGMMAAVAIALFVFVESPFGLLFGIFTIDPSTAYYRYWIWSMAVPVILTSPIYGISDPFAGIVGVTDEKGSIDSLWLNLALSYGLPCAILTALAMIGSCSLNTADRSARLSQVNGKIGTLLGITIFLAAFMGFTVHFWGSIWIFFSLLLGLRASLGELGRLNTIEPGRVEPA